MPADSGPPASPRPLTGPAAPAPAPAIAPRPLGERIRAYRLLLGLATAVFGVDQSTKAWVAAHLPYNPYHLHGGGNDIVVSRDFFYLIHVGNTGAAWSMFAGQSVFLALLAAGTLIAIYFWRHALGLRDRIAQFCFGLLSGGIAGNFVDRLVHGHVIDFLDFHFGPRYIYPTFNVADSGICVGVILFLWQSFRAPK
jgi:signal peptidase II